MPLPLKRIDVVVLFVADLERTKAFYRDTIGLQLKFEDDTSTFFGLENTNLLLVDIGSGQDLLSADAVPAQRPAGAASQLVAFVDNVDEVYRELIAKGVEFVRDPESRAWGMRTAHFKDPEGNIWELAQDLSRTSKEG